MKGNLTVNGKQHFTLNLNANSKGRLAFERYRDGEVDKKERKRDSEREREGKRVGKRERESEKKIRRNEQ